MMQDDDATETIFDAARFATVTVGTTYPIVSAWEFDTLKEESIIRERWDACTIYMIVQRPLTYFDNVVIGGEHIFFDIADGDKPPLSCRINLVANNICEDGETVEIVVGFHSDATSREQPFRNVGALKIFGEDSRFILWWSPQKILYEMLIKNLDVDIVQGDVSDFLDFKVHYIGKSFSQKVWDRLASHAKQQKILTREREVGSAPEARAPLEISLIILGVAEFNDIPMVGDLEGHPLVGPNPIIKQIDCSVEGACEQFMNCAPIALGDAALTTEIEAMLINRFQPAYNDIKFKKYPNIKGGMRAQGYSWTGLKIENMPAFLYTDHFSLVPTTGEESHPVDGGGAPPDWESSLVEMLFRQSTESV